MSMSPTQSETSARRFLVNRMGSQAGRFLLPRRTGSLICRYPSISKSGRIPAWGRDEKAQQSLKQSHRSAAGGAKFWNCAGRHARHSRQAETPAEIKEQTPGNQHLPTFLHLFFYTTRFSI